jgi:formylglycine-generating enzyme required for sulfatase activity
MLKIVTSLVISLTGVSAAFPCSLSRAPDFAIDDAIDDSEPPTAAVVGDVRISRGNGPLTENGRFVQSNSCDDIGVISIHMDAHDQNVGYFLALVDGVLPGGLSLPDAPRSLARHAPMLTLSWLDGARDRQDAFGFTLRITSVDRAGNLGEPVEAVIEDDGIPGAELAARRAKQLETVKKTFGERQERERQRRETSRQQMSEAHQQWHDDKRKGQQCGPSSAFSANKWCLPDDPMLGFVEVPAGSFVMGTDPSNLGGAQAAHVEDEVWPNTPTGQGTVDLPRFYIGRFEVTVAQFWEHIQSANVEHTGPGLLAERDHPMAGVSWHEALAYSKWLDQVLRRDGPDPLKAILNSGLCVGLPSEAQWEKAARGVDGRIWPWGSVPEQPDGRPRAAYRFKDERRGGHPLSVGSFDCPECPYGLADMAGNAWEWTRSLWWPYPYVSTDGRESLTSSGSRVARGGAFDSSASLLRSASRLAWGPDRPRHELGLRVVVSEQCVH